MASLKTLFLIATILLSSMLAKAQDMFFPSKEGVVLEYKDYNSKGNQTGSTRYTITKVNRVGSDTYITYLMLKKDENDKVQFEHEITVHNKDDKLHLDMSSIFRQSILKEKGELPKNFKISGSDVITPSDLKVGDKLPNSHVKMAIKKGIINIKVAINITDRLVEAREDITIPAGNFEAFKINSKMSTKASIIKKHSASSEWLVKGIGMVKSESYNKKGELESYTELVSIED